MKIVVNHLTRMKPGYICVAGIDPSDAKHVRPVLAGSRLTTALLRREGGPFDMAAVVDLGTVQAKGSPPEVEDHVFDPQKTTSTSILAPAEFWELLEAAAEQTLGAIFGKDLKPSGASMAVDLGKGTASLGCLALAAIPVIDIDHRYDKVKLEIEDAGRQLSVGVTDLRLFEPDQKTPRTKVIDDLNRRLHSGVGSIVSVGLSRAFIKTGDTEERHFLQVNNLHLKDDPTWQAR